jgi:hypothetical protein
MIRTKIKAKTPTQPSGLMGGHMPDPPEDCTGPRMDFNPADGRKYINTVFCRDCKNICQRRKDFVREWKEYRAWLREKDGHPTRS